MFAGIMALTYLITALVQVATTFFAAVECQSMLDISPSKLYSHVVLVIPFSGSPIFTILLLFLLLLIEDN